MPQLGSLVAVSTIATIASCGLFAALRWRRNQVMNENKPSVPYAQLIETYVDGMMASNAIAIGHKLDLFTKLYEQERPVTSEEFANSTQLCERWIREWLGCMSASKMIDCFIDGSTVTFSLCTEAAMVLCPFNGVNGENGYGETSIVGLVQLCAGLGARIPQITRCFKTGAGLPYDFKDEECDIADGICGIHADTFQNKLVPILVPHFSKQLGSEVDLLKRLEQGARIADVGCGAGGASIAFAKAFPNSEVHGFELSKSAISKARENVKHAGLSNVTIHDVETEPLDGSAYGGTFDFVFCYDLIHDTPFPGEIIQIMKKGLKPNNKSAILVVDIEGCGCVAGNIRKQGIIRWGISLMLCMPSGLTSTGQGLGLGTHGLYSTLGRKFFVDAGFSNVSATEQTPEFEGMMCYSAVL